MRIRIVAIALACAAAAVSLTARADGDAAKGKVAAYTCIGCHDPHSTPAPVRWS